MLVDKCVQTLLNQIVITLPSLQETYFKNWINVLTQLTFQLSTKM